MPRLLLQPVFGVILAISVIFMAAIATLVRSQRAELAPATWLPAATIVAAAYEIAYLAYLVFLRAQVHGRMGDRFRTSGRDLVEFIGIAGVGFFLFPACTALFLSFIGLPLLYVWVAAGFSAIGTLVWSFLYRSDDRGKSSRQDRTHAA